MSPVLTSIKFNCFLRNWVYFQVWRRLMAKKVFIFWTMDGKEIILASQREVWSLMQMDKSWLPLLKKTNKKPLFFIFILFFILFLEATAASGDHSKARVWVPVAISNLKCNWVYDCFMWHIHWLKTDKGLRNVFNYSNAICKLSIPPKRALHSWEEKRGSKLSQDGEIRKIGDVSIHSPSLQGLPSPVFRA